MTAEERERLAILAEECGEIIQIVGKILRHGYDSYNPYDTTKQTNRDKLETELADVFLITDHMHSTNDINLDNIPSKKEVKKKKINKYLHHNTI